MTNHRKHISNAGIAALELIVLIFVIGILAAISVFVITNKTKDSPSAHRVTVPSAVQISVDGSTGATESIDTQELADEAKQSTAGDNSFTQAINEETAGVQKISEAYDDNAL